MASKIRKNLLCHGFFILVNRIYTGSSDVTWSCGISEDQDLE